MIPNRTGLVAVLVLVTLLGCRRSAPVVTEAPTLAWQDTWPVLVLTDPHLPQHLDPLDAVSGLWLISPARSDAAPWPDPLPPLRAPLSLKAGVNQPLWIRVNVPRGTRHGDYAGTIAILSTGEIVASAPLRGGLRHPPQHLRWPRHPRRWQRHSPP